jgi:hypothetical protein
MATGGWCLRSARFRLLPPASQVRIVFTAEERVPELEKLCKVITVGGCPVPPWPPAGLGTWHGEGGAATHRPSSRARVRRVDAVVPIQLLTSDAVTVTGKTFGWQLG